MASDSEHASQLLHGMASSFKSQEASFMGHGTEAATFRLINQFIKAGMQDRKPSCVSGNLIYPSRYARREGGPCL